MREMKEMKEMGEQMMLEGMPEVEEPEASTSHVDESGNVFVTNYYGEATSAMLAAPAQAYTDAHWAIEKAIEIYKAQPEEIIEGAEAILAFLKEHAGAQGSAESSAEEAEILYNMNSEPVYGTENTQRRSWR